MLEKQQEMLLKQQVESVIKDQLPNLVKQQVSQITQEHLNSNKDNNKVIHSRQSSPVKLENIVSAEDDAPSLLDGFDQLSASSSLENQLPRLSLGDSLPMSSSLSQSLPSTIPPGLGSSLGSGLYPPGMSPLHASIMRSRGLPIPGPSPYGPRPFVPYGSRPFPPPGLVPNSFAGPRPYPPFNPYAAASSMQGRFIPPPPPPPSPFAPHSSLHSMAASMYPSFYGPNARSSSPPNSVGPIGIGGMADMGKSGPGEEERTDTKGKIKNMLVDLAISSVLDVGMTKLFGKINAEPGSK